MLDIFKEEELINIKYTGHSHSNYLVDQCLYTECSENSDRTWLFSGSEDGFLYKWNVEKAGDGVKVLYNGNGNSNNGNILNGLDINRNSIAAISSFPDMNINFWKV